MICCYCISFEPICFLFFFFSFDDDPSKVPPKDDNNDDDTNLGDDWTLFSGQNRNRQFEDVPTSEDSSDSSEDEFVGSVTFNRLTEEEENPEWSRNSSIYSSLLFSWFAMDR